MKCNIVQDSYMKSKCNDIEKQMNITFLDSYIKCVKQNARDARGHSPNSYKK